MTITTPAALRADRLLTDLGMNIGSAAWWRGCATLLGLGSAAFGISTLAPIRVLEDEPLAHRWSTDAINLAPLVITPLRDGAETGWSVGMGPLARPLAEAPEKPRVERVLRLAKMDDAATLLHTAAVSRDDMQAALQAIKAAIDPRVAMPGGAAMVTLGRRDSKRVPRPLERLVYRAAFEQWVEVSRAASGFTARLVPIRIDATPLRVVGRIGSALASSARETGAPRAVAETFLAQMGYAIDFERDVRRADKFEMLFEREVAETGDVRTGNLLHAVLISGKNDEKIELTRFAPPGEKPQYFTPDGISVKRLLMKTPVDGARMSSGFGWRLHPILGYSRLHRGVDFAAPPGTPVMAAGNGTVIFAARGGGYGNVIKITHPGGYATAYAHLQSFGKNIRAGARVEQGQTIGYVGTTGLSTGPHLHYEVYAKGAPVNPNDAKLPTGRWLEGVTKAKFFEQLEKFRAVKARPTSEMAASDADPARG